MKYCSHEPISRIYAESSVRDRDDSAVGIGSLWRGWSEKNGVIDVARVTRLDE